MRNKFMFAMLSFGLIAAFILTACAGAAGGTVKIGLNIEITGDKPKVGEQSKFAAEMFQAEVNEAGGIDIGGKKYQIELVIEDNNATPEGAVSTANKLISQDNILIMIGPNPSNAAVPAGGGGKKNENQKNSPP